MSEPDPIDEASARLFTALRDEAPPSGAADRALRAARGELDAAPPVIWLRRPLLWGGVMAAGAVAATIALWPQPDMPTNHISAEPASSLRRVRAEEPAASALEPAPEIPSARPRAVAPPTPSHAPPATLSDELSALKSASNALNAGDAQAALAALDHYERVLKGSQLRAEATLLRIQALARAGQATAASDLATQFVERNPNSPLVDRARSYVQEK